MRLAIVTPIYSAVPGPAHDSMVDLAYEIGRTGGRLWRKTMWLCSNLVLARTLLSRWAAATEAEKVLFADDDVVFTPDDVRALYAIDEEIVSGTYTRRELDAPIVGAAKQGPEGTNRGALIEMVGVGFGFLLVRRDTLARALEAHGDDLFRHRQGQAGPGEDDAFSHRLVDAGVRMWLHTGVQLGHVGPHVFRMR